VLSVLRFSFKSQIVVPEFRQSENSQETGSERVQDKIQNRKKTKREQKESITKKDQDTERTKSERDKKKNTEKG